MNKIQQGFSNCEMLVGSLNVLEKKNKYRNVFELLIIICDFDSQTSFSVRSQISTITMATFNTTVASFNVGYTDFFTEHIKKLCNPIPIPEMPCEPLACSNLPRSLTDSCINYTSLEDRDTIEGTNNFILKNGMLDLMVRGSALSKGAWVQSHRETNLLYSFS